MAFTKCPKCGTKITISAFGVIKCPSCGCAIKVGTPPGAPKPGNEPPPWPLPEEPKAPMKKCKHCMSDIPINANVCPHCRRKQKGGVVKWVILGVAAAVIVIFVGLLAIGLAVSDSESEPSSAQVETKNKKEPSGEYIEEGDIDKVYSNPNGYRGKRIKVSGRIFMPPEMDDNYTYFQMWGDAENSERNTIIRVKNTGQDLKTDTYVIVNGEIKGSYDGENMFGGAVSALQVDADSVEISDYMTVVAPTMNMVEPNAQIDQYGYVVTVQKIEFAKNETRVYLNIKNNGSANFDFYSFNTRIIQDSKQYDEQDNYEAGYPEINSSLVPGAETSGVIAFPNVEYKSLQIYAEGYSNNWEEEVQPYQFDIPIQ